jgi:NAD(P)-dependent dehydrogenase (short-subunit alcohol dehydrogenase family)
MGMSTLKGKVAVVTGGARGIGAATAAALREAGATVVIGDLPDLDVTDPDLFRSFLDEVEKTHGPLDILVNNAGIMPVGHLHEESEAVARRMFEINVFGVITGTKRALESMLPRRSGHIVNVASMAGLLYAPGAATYVGSRHAVLGFTETARLEYARSGIEFTAVLPAFVNTELTAGTKGVPGMKTVQPEDVADAIVAALAKPVPRVYVPKMAGRLAAIQKFAPRRAAEALTRRLGGDTVFLDDVDQSQRKAYEERARHS